MSDPVPWDELDPPIVGLVKALNALPGVETTGSCGGHEKADYEGQTPAECWLVTFRLEPQDRDATVAVPTREGWVSLEFVSWLINSDMARAGRRVGFHPSSPPPFVNLPGRTLRFVLEGRRDGDGGIEPDDLAETITSRAEQFYVPAEDAWPADPDDPAITGKPLPGAPS